ncbi:MAG TPA: hypothetical protein VFV52_12890 [Bacilli bacterium]|nr:hypothetical protein [Bacilli bacterium]
MQKQLPFVALLPAELPSDWKVERLSVRPESSRWSTLWHQVHSPTAQFRVKEFFLDIMEPTFPDTCITAAMGDCFQTEQLTYWRGTNYKGRDSYVLSLWKTQVEISIDCGTVSQPDMERFLDSLQPVDPERAQEIVRKPFHEISFHARTGRGQAEVARCSKWVAPEQSGVQPPEANLPEHWVLESIGLGHQEVQFVYWDPQAKVYSLWASRHQQQAYHPTSSWSRNYSSKVQRGDYEFYEHPERGTVVYHQGSEQQTAYVFRGLPTTTPEQVKSFFPLEQQ